MQIFTFFLSRFGLPQSVLILHGEMLKNTKENDSRRFFGLFDQKFISKSPIDFKNPFCWSRRIFWYPYCHILCHLCHVTCVIKWQKNSFYGILWHMSRDINDMNYGNMGIKRSVLISRIDIKAYMPFWYFFFIFYSNNTVYSSFQATTSSID